MARWPSASGAGGVAFPDLGENASWFLALPDGESAIHGAGALLRDLPGLRQIPHRSGRPWLLGRWAEGECVAVDVGRTGRLALFGEHAVDGRRLARLVPGASSIGGLDRLSGTVPGSFHLIASIDGDVRVQGTASGLRRVFHARLDGTTVAGDRAIVLAALTGERADDERLIWQLPLGALPWPLSWQPMWHGVHSVEPGHALFLDSTGRHRVGRWWRPPEQDLSLPAGGSRFAGALSESVRTRLAGPRPAVAADLSGVDSSSLCVLAARHGARVSALTLAGPDAMDDDAPCAVRTVAALRRAGRDVDHVLLPSDEAPLPYEGVLDTAGTLDEPAFRIWERARFLRLFDLGLRRGAEVHLTGLGGDEVLGLAPQWAHALAGEKPHASLRLARLIAARSDTSCTKALRALLDRRSYPKWLASHANDIGRLADTALGWGSPVHLPPWLTRDAATAIADALRAASRAAWPLGRTRWVHVTLDAVHQAATVTRQYQQLARGGGTRLAAPYLDDSVVESALAVDASERGAPDRPKALIVEAMRGVVPASALLGRTQSTGLPVLQGMAVHRHELMALADGSLLADRGLIDAGALRDALLRPVPPHVNHMLYSTTLGCEAWLRSLARPA